jgi:glycosyltransferase involved in cell wall biosynthesis
MSTSLRICLVVHNLPPAYTGGGLQAVTLASELKRQGHSVFFVSQTHRRLPSRGSLDGIEVYRIDADTATERRLGQTLVHTAKLTRVLLRLRASYDVVLFFNPDGGFHNSWPVIALLHVLGKRTATRMTLLSSSDPSALRRRRFGFIHVLPYRLHHRVISISTALSLSHEDVFGRSKRLALIPNGVDTSRFKPVSAERKAELRRELGLEPHVRYAVFVGRISYRKGVDTLIDAWSRIAAEHKDVRLLMIGPRADEYRNVEEAKFLGDIEQRIARYGIGDSVLWVGRTEHVERYLQASDLFLFTSRREGCPNALLEAMACGVPIVTTRIPNITEDLVSAEADGLITAPDAASFAEAVLRLLSAPGLAQRLGTRAASKADTEFSISHTAARYAQVLRFQ